MQVAAFSPKCSEQKYPLHFTQYPLGHAGIPLPSTMGLEQSGKLHLSDDTIIAHNSPISIWLIDSTPMQLAGVVWVPSVQRAVEWGTLSIMALNADSALPRDIVFSIPKSISIISTIPSMESYFLHHPIEPQYHQLFFEYLLTFSECVLLILLS
mgnify:CR=1 FL=1